MENLNQTLEAFVEALRQELQGYGELLALMESQQQLIISRDSPKIESSASNINRQFHIIQKLKESRSDRQKELSACLGLSNDALYENIRKRLPSEYVTLTDALVEENNELLKEVRVKAKQNQLLLFRTVEMMQEFINHIIPRTEEKSYDATGTSATRSSSQANIYEAMG